MAVRGACLNSATAQAPSCTSASWSILTALPKVDWNAAHALADDLGAASADQRFETFFTVLLGIMAKAIRAAAGPERTAPAWSIPPERAPAWAELWEAIVREKDEALELNLDRRALILSTLSGLAAVRPRLCRGGIGRAIRDMHRGLIGRLSR